MHDLSRVLLVEPHNDTREMYAEALRYDGLRSIEVDNAADALRHASKVDVVVTAIRLRGEIDGVELIRRLRHDGSTRTKPVIVVSTCVGQSDRERAAKAGCSAFLSKPCLPETLVAKVHQLFARLRLFRARVDRATARARQLRDRSNALFSASGPLRRKRKGRAR